MKRNKEIIKLFKGLDTYAEIARKVKLSPTRVRQIIIDKVTTKGIDYIKKLRSEMKKKAREKLWNERYFKDPVYREKTIERAKARYRRLYPAINK